VIHRLRAALTTRPRQEEWQQTALLLALLALISLPLGFTLGFLRVHPVLSWPTAPRVLLATFLFPAVIEELLFRVLLVPHPHENATRQARWLWASLALLLFVASHPLKAALFPPHRAVFAEPAFLILATLLGLACTLAYLRTGSLWPPILLHWLAVAAWLLLLGGYDRVSTAITPEATPRRSIFVRRAAPSGSHIRVPAPLSSDQNQD
jgi:predicted Abi (CAAX) family protease